MKISFDFEMTEVCVKAKISYIIGKYDNLDKMIYKLN